MSSGSTLRISKKRQPPMCVAYVAGEVDLANAAEFRAELADVQDPLLVIEFSALRYIDSAGMRALDEVLRHAGAQGCDCRIVAPPGTPARMTLRVAGFEEDALYEDVEAARHPIPPTD